MYMCSRYLILCQTFELYISVFFNTLPLIFICVVLCVLYNVGYEF